MLQLRCTHLWTSLQLSNREPKPEYVKCDSADRRCDLISARPGKTNAVCDLVRSELESRDVLHYAKTILTAHVRKIPQDYESALRVLVQLKGLFAHDSIKS